MRYKVMYSMPQPGDVLRHFGNAWKLVGRPSRVLRSDSRTVLVQWYATPQPPAHTALPALGSFRLAIPRNAWVTNNQTNGER